MLLARCAARDETWSDAGRLDAELDRMLPITRHDADSVRRRVSALLPIERNVHPAVTLYCTAKELLDVAINKLGELHTHDTSGWSKGEELKLY